MTIDERIDELIALGNTDPHSAAREILGQLTPREVREALEEALPTYIRQRMRVNRLPPASQIRDLARFRTMEWAIDGRWDPAGKFTAEDCRWLAEDYARRAEGNGNWSDVWYDMARALEKYQAKTIASLPDSAVRAALQKGAGK